MTENTLDIEPEFMPLYESCRQASMTSIERMHALWLAVRHLGRAGIEGDIVECGVWRGGSMMLAAKTLISQGDTARRLWLYDTFDGMPPPSDLDFEAASGRSAGDILSEVARDEDNLYWGLAARELVERNMNSTGYPADRIVYVAGRVEDTLPGQRPERIALLRLDTDWYISTRHELEHLWPVLEPGGILIIDDYGHWAGARRAVDEFFDRLSRPPLLARIDFTGRLAVKI